MKSPSQPAIAASRCAESATPYLQAYDALLKKWPVAYESLLVPTPHGVTHVIASGPRDAAPLVLLHGMHATALVWKANVEALSRHFRVYALDVIGQGGKSRTDALMRKRRDYAAWLCDVFDALGIDAASLVGSSYGAFLALNQASLQPERVHKVVLINPAGIFVSVLPLAVPFLRDKILQALRLQHGLREPADLARYMGSDVQFRPDELEWASLVCTPARSRRARPNMAFPRVFSTAELRAIRAPTLLLMGDNDLLYDPLLASRKAKLRMPALEVQILQGAHHIAAMAKPADANAALLRFLATQRMFCTT